MNASDEASDPFERLAVLELRAAPAAARVHGEAEPGMLAGKGRRDDRNFVLRQFSCEGMLFRDLARRQRTARRPEFRAPPVLFRRHALPRSGARSSARGGRT